MRVHASFRDVDEEVFKDFKAILAHESMKSGDALTEAMRLFLKQFKKSRKKKQGLMDLKPIDFGNGSEHSSKEIDEVVYGGI